jgi:hypothetical protein
LAEERLIMGGHPDPTKEELTMLCEWAREGKLRALRGYLLAGITYYREWGTMDGVKVMAFCRDLVRVTGGMGRRKGVGR